jgi:hypothetical protein
MKIRLAETIAEFPVDDEKARPKYIKIGEKIDYVISRDKGNFLTKPL